MKKQRAAVLQNVEDNFAAFKEAEFAKSKDEIFGDAYKINFMESVLDYFEGIDTFDNKIYAFLTRDKDQILNNLYKHYMSFWNGTVSTVEEFEDFVRDYNDTYFERGSEM